MGAIVYGATKAVTYIEGRRYSIHIDQPYDSDSEIVRARPDLFSERPDRIGGVQTATAAPGEVKTRKRAAKS